MKKCKITVMRMACHQDLMEKYESPMEHACDMKEGRVFIANGWKKPESFSSSSNFSCSLYVYASIIFYSSLLYIFASTAK